VLVFRDVTEKRLTERERVAAFDRELEARHRAEEANRLKDDFLATISHELRTPLNAILGWSAILRSDNAPPEAMSRGLDTIERNARSQAQLIEDLLDASRITQGVLHLNVSTVDPVRVIHAAIDAVQLAADTRGVEISMTLAPDSGQLAGDSQRLQQVIWNLLSNAIKFSPRGSRIDVSLVRLGDVIEIAVADCGRGISAEFLPHVFERFRQADASASRNQGGVGLGLAIVKQLIELHGGSVEATSEGEGKGATFTVRLPVSTTRRESGREATTGPMASPSGVSAEFVPVSLLGLRVAVVEDEADTRDMIEHLLGLCEAEVRTAASASEGLELVRTWRPDLLISDIGMPNRDGFAFIRDVRALPRDQGGAVPAIALTGYAGVEDRVRVLATGFQMHIAKPVEPEEFVAVVASVVGFERQQSMANRDGHGPVD
jgi:CheY-like chemotaxis protein/nitrogen-specific signal transduction histidine kinase